MQRTEEDIESNRDSEDREDPEVRIQHDDNPKSGFRKLLEATGKLPQDKDRAVRVAEIDEQIAATQKICARALELLATHRQALARAATVTAVRRCSNNVNAYNASIARHENYIALLEDARDNSNKTLEALHASLLEVHDAGRFQLPHGLLATHGGRGRALVVWVARMLRWFQTNNAANWKRQVFMSARRMSYDSGLTVDQCVEAARKAEQLGWVVSKKRKTQGKSKYPTKHYQLTDLWTVTEGKVHLKTIPQPGFWGLKGTTVWHRPNLARLMHLSAAHTMELIDWMVDRDTKQLVQQQGLSVEDARAAVREAGIRISDKEICSRLCVSSKVLRYIRELLTAWGVTVRQIECDGRLRQQITVNGKGLTRDRLSRALPAPVKVEAKPDKPKSLEAEVIEAEAEEDEFA